DERASRGTARGRAGRALDSRRSAGVLPVVDLPERVPVVVRAFRRTRLVVELGVLLEIRVLEVRAARRLRELTRGEPRLRVLRLPMHRGDVLRERSTGPALVLERERLRPVRIEQ